MGFYYEIHKYSYEISNERDGAIDVSKPAWDTPEQMGTSFGKANSEERIGDLTRNHECRGMRREGERAKGYVRGRRMSESPREGRK
jgi:hypothetical protein